MNTAYRREVAGEYLEWITVELRKIAARRLQEDLEHEGVFARVVRMRTYLAAGIAGIGVTVSQFLWP